MNHKPMQQGMLEKLAKIYPHKCLSIDQTWRINPEDEFGHGGYTNEWQLWIEGTTIECFPEFEQLWNRVNELCKDNEPIIKSVKTDLGNIDPYEGMKDNYRGD